MSKSDYYESLGVTKNSSASEIKQAYRRLARKYHPDVNKTSDAETKFKEVQEAYDVLGDDQKKAQYDQFGHAGMDGFGGGGFGGFDTGGFSDGFGDIFDMFFNGQGGQQRRGGRQRQGPIPGNDLRYDLKITLEDAFSGLEKELDIHHLVTCTTCSGSGAKPGTKPTTCSTCGGQGAVRQEQRTILGSFATTTTCPSCGGSGSMIVSPCSNCQGRGVERKKETVKVKIPPGVDEGSRLRVPGAGDSGQHGGQPGDLYIFLSISQNKLFSRQGNDLHVNAQISFTQAALGSEIEIQTIDEKLKIKVPPGTQSHTSFRMKDKGMPTLQGRSRGALNVLVEVVTPSGLTKEQKEVLQKFAELRGE